MFSLFIFLLIKDISSKQRNLQNCNFIMLNEKSLKVINLVLVIRSSNAQYTSFRSTHPKVFLGKGLLKICSKFTEEHPYRSVMISITLLCNFCSLHINGYKNVLNSVLVMIFVTTIISSCFLLLCCHFLR